MLIATVILYPVKIIFNHFRIFYTLVILFNQGVIIVPIEWKSVFHQRINELYQRAKDTDYKLTQEQYATRLKTSRSGLRGWLSGKGQPDADGLAWIAKIEHVSLYWLIGGNDAQLSSPTHSQPFTPEELEHIKKYRTLDERDKLAVDTLTYTLSDVGIKTSKPNHTPETIAAHSDDPKNPLPPEALASIEAFKVKMRAKYGKK
jgi:transcriptional regulator with XRE-family HTH domain